MTSNLLVLVTIHTKKKDRFRMGTILGIEIDEGAVSDTAFQGFAGGVI